MGIVDWFTNDLSTEERALTRDLLSVAIADHEFNEEEQKAILKIGEKDDVIEFVFGVQRVTPRFSIYKTGRSGEEIPTYSRAGNYLCLPYLVCQQNR